MRLVCLHAFLFVVCATVSSSIVGDINALLPRQDNSPKTAATITGSARARVTETSLELTATEVISNPHSDPSSEDAHRGKTRSSLDSAVKATSSLRRTSSETTAVPTATITGSALSRSSSNSTSNADPNKLPISPAITPALSVAGAYLILSGAFYTLIGIKTKWLHIFLSAAYLTSLAVTVLIIYVMHPPISNAVQGAYFVAIWATGIIFGGGSVVFADVTEGLACLFGGFCLSMWFLVLKPGGLITSTAGRAILIASFTLGAFGFYVSHFTRPYGLIGSTSFAGATVIVLGIDCFSRAGLKEFWLYIWDLNAALFPFHYRGPYPITRGIRVEVACIILLFLLGIMSQIRVWNVIKERRDKKKATEMEEEQRRDQADKDLGRRLEEGNGRERAAWEAVYGDRDSSKQEADSALETDTCASTRKGSLNAVGIREVRNSGVENIEMSNLGALAGSSRKRSYDGTRIQGHPQVTVRVGAEDELQEVPIDETMTTNDGSNRDSHVPVGISLVKPTASDVEINASNQAISASNNEFAPPTQISCSTAPPIIPLPFHVPDAAAESGDDASSIATFAASDRIPIQDTHKEYFGHSPIHLPRNSRNISEEALLVPHIDDDGASSVAATVDGVSTEEEFAEDDMSGKVKSLKSIKNSQENLLQSAEAGQSSSWEGLDGQHRSNALKPGDHPLKRIGSLGEESSIVENGAGKHTRDIEVKGPENTPSHQKSDVSEPVGKQTNLNGNLPTSTSKVVMAYRTNEWAKHLGAAESPELDDLMSGPDPVGLDLTRTEAARPVNFKDLQQTPLTAEPAAISRDPQPTQNIGRSLSATSKDSLLSNQNPQELKTRHRSSVPPMERALSRVSSHGPLSRKESPNSSQLRLSLSQTSLTGNRGYRSSSTPLANSPLVESPIAEDVEVTFPPRFSPSPMNLMSKRDSMVRNKPSSTSLNRFTPSPFPSSMASPSNEHLPPQDLSALEEAEEDNIPLSRRKSFLQLHQNLQHQSSRSSLILPQSQPQPQRSISNPRTSTLSAWRSSLRADLPAQQAVQEQLESRRTEMINEKRRTSSSQQWAQLEAGRRESDIDRGMRRGDLMDLHREAMRKMQGVANRNL